MGLLDGRVAIVTGSGRGIGREFALSMAKQGARLVPHQPALSRGHDRVIDLVVGAHSAKCGLQLPAAGADRWKVGDNDRKLDEPTIASGIHDAEGAGVVVELCVETRWDGAGQ